MNACVRVLHRLDGTVMITEYVSPPRRGGNAESQHSVACAQFGRRSGWLDFALSAIPRPCVSDDFLPLMSVRRTFAAASVRHSGGDDVGDGRFRRRNRGRGLYATDGAFR